MPPNRRAVWRAYLAQCFADATYDAVRDELVAALCSDVPHYHFTGADGTLYAISWWDRDHAPAVKSIRRGSHGDADGMPAPTIRTYPDVAGDV